MSTDKSGGINLLGLAMRGGLVLVTGYQTWNFLQTMMGAQAQLVAILGIIAFEGGMLFWGMYHNYVALSSEQQFVSSVLEWADLAGVSLAFIGEVMFNRPDVQFPTWLPTIALVGTTVVIIANVAGFNLIARYAPATIMARALRQSKMARQAVEVDLQLAKAEQMKTDGAQLAIEMASGLSAHEMGGLRNQYAVPVNGADFPKAQAPLLADSGTSPTVGNGKSTAKPH